eukprot:1141866-Pelagomonas_calceolata.AAC.5
MGGWLLGLLRDVPKQSRNAENASKMHLCVFLQFIPIVCTSMPCQHTSGLCKDLVQQIQCEQLVNTFKHPRLASSTHSGQLQQQSWSMQPSGGPQCFLSSRTILEHLPQWWAKVRATKKRAMHAVIRVPGAHGFQVGLRWPVADAA